MLELTLFAEWRVVPEYVVCFFVWQAHLVPSLECNGIRFRRVLFGLEEPLCQRMFCRMKGMTVVC